MNPIGLSVSAVEIPVSPSPGTDQATQGTTLTSEFAGMLAALELQAPTSGEAPSQATRSQDARSQEARSQDARPKDTPAAVLSAEHTSPGQSPETELPDKGTDTANVDAVALTYNLVITMPQTVPAQVPLSISDSDASALDRTVTIDKSAILDVAEELSDKTPLPSAAGASELSKSGPKRSRASKSAEASEVPEPMSRLTPENVVDPFQLAPPVVVPSPPNDKASSSIDTKASKPHDGKTSLPPDGITPSSVTLTSESGAGEAARNTQIPTSSTPFALSRGPGENAPVVMEARITPKATSEPKKPINQESASITPTKEETNRETSSIEPVVKAEPADEHALARKSPAQQEEREAPLANEVPHGQSAANHAELSAVQKEPERLAPTPRAATSEVSRQPYIAPEETQIGKAAYTPLKQMDLRIPDANGDVVVRLQERAGSVHVSVRTNDSLVANNITEGLPELTRTLDRQGFQAETWTPRQAGISDLAGAAAKAHTEMSQAAHEVSSRTEHLQAPQTEPAQAGNENNDGHRKPDWQEELYKRPKRPSEENFKEYLW